MFDLELDLGEAVARLALAMLLGGLIGWEREAKRRPAGLRTYMLVCLGSATLAVIASALLTPGSSVMRDKIELDPTRILQGVVGGIGFLGAGAILRHGGRVEGLTTAAGLWVTAALGITAGLGLYWLAAVAGALTFLTIAVLRHVDKAIVDASGANGTDENPREENGKGSG